MSHETSPNSSPRPQAVLGSGVGYLPDAALTRAAGEAAMVAEVTKFTKTDGDCLSKLITFNPATGKPQSDGSDCRMSSGIADRVVVRGGLGLKMLIERLDSREAIALGALRSDLPKQCIITTNEGDGSLSEGMPRIGRTKGNFEYVAGRPAFVLIDFDAKGMPPEVRARAAELAKCDPATDLTILMVKALRLIVGPLTNGSWLLRKSTSAGLFHADTKEHYPSSGGFHLYVLIRDGGDARRFLSDLHDRCWLAGLGWIVASKSGQLLERSPVDRSVASAERLVFEGPPVVKAPLAQLPRSILAGDGPAIDSYDACLPLSDVEQRKVQRLKAEAKKALAPESAHLRTAFIDATVRTLIERDRSLTEYAAREAAERQAGGTLLPESVLIFDDHDIGTVPVAALLADPAKFVGRTLSDPNEGPAYGLNKAIVYRHPTGALWIYSFAHGGQRYWIEGRCADMPLAEDEFSATDDTPLEMRMRERQRQALVIGRCRLPPGRKPVFDPKAFDEIARAYLDIHGLNGKLWHWHGEFRHWNGRYYEAVPDTDLESALRYFLDDAQRKTKDGPVPFAPSDYERDQVLSALRNSLLLKGVPTAPAWLAECGYAPAREYFAVANGLLHILTRELQPFTPALFNLGAADYAYDPGAPEPRLWIKFLHDLWPDDPEAIALLQEWFGYLIAGGLDQQKMLLLMGPTRSGKGVICEVLTALIGAGNVGSPTLAGLAGPFGLAPLLGKSLALISDMRLGHGTDQATIVERLLTITGGGGIDVAIKHKSALPNVPLLVRFMVVSNQVPALADASKALAGRFLPLGTTISFYGREDETLAVRIIAGEIGGILKWALAGHRRRLARGGKFVVPASSARVAEMLRGLSSPITLFVEDCAIIGAGERVSKADLYAAWRTWCQGHGRDKPGTMEIFARDLYEAFPAISETKLRNEQGGRDRCFAGIDLRDEFAPDNDDLDNLISR